MRGQLRRLCQHFSPDGHGDRGVLEKQPQQEAGLLRYRGVRRVVLPASEGGADVGQGRRHPGDRHGRSEPSGAQRGVLG